MELQGVWLSSFIDKYAPGMECGAAPFPYPENRPDLACTTINECDTLVIPKDARHPDEAFRFIAFVQSAPGMPEVRKCVAKYGLTPMEILNLGHRKHVPLRQAGEKFWNDHPHPYVRLFYDLSFSPNTRTTLKLGFWNACQDEMNAAFDAVWTCSKTPAEALQIAQERLQERLDREKRRMGRKIDARGRPLWDVLVETEARLRPAQRQWRIPLRTLRPALGPNAHLMGQLFPANAAAENE
jgi:multiple sugar transport system substrate-binding protein